MTRSGVTLLELIVVLTLIAVLYTISAISLTMESPSHGIDSSSTAVRVRALREGRAVRIGNGTPQAPWRLFLPDGRTLSATKVEP